MSETIELKLVPVREFAYKSETNWGAYACRTEEDEKVKINKQFNNFSISGVLPRLSLDEEYDATLEEVYDKKYGYKYNVVSIHQEIPTDPEKQKKYLQSILTKNQVESLYKAYPNKDIIELFKQDKIEIEKVHGLGKRNYDKMKNKIIENEEYHVALSFLSEYIDSNNLIMRLVRHFRSTELLIQSMKENPYCITNVHSVGFKTADPIALRMGYDKEGKHRIHSAIEYSLEENEKEGNTYIQISKLIDKVEELIGISSSLIAEQISEINRAMIIDDKVAFKNTYQNELSVANKLMEMLDNSTELNFDVEDFIKRMEIKHSLKLTDQQKTLFYNFKKYNVVLLIGFAGVGKSQMMTLLIELLDELNMTYDLLSPTGKAAKVLSNYTKREAKTIHRAIGMGKHEEDEEEREPILDKDSNKVDEVSMLDIRVASSMLEEIKDDARIVLIGDSAQIPSVGCGNLLHDLIESKKIPMTLLDIVFRQKEGGLLDIITKVRKNERFVKNDFIGIKKFTDSVTLASVPQEKMIGGLKYYYNDLLKRYSPEDIMVLSPTKKGDLGTHAINNYIQSIINKDGNNPIKQHKDKVEVYFKEGDYVMNVVNTYGILNVRGVGIDLVNGDTGKITKIDEENDEVVIDFEFDQVPFTLSQLSQLVHSWSITMHKSQGSQSRAVLVVLDKSHKYMSNANLLYTALSRTQEELIILTQAETLNFAMRKVINLQRKTFLKDMLVNRD